MSAQVLPIKKTDSIAAMMPVHQFEAKDYLLMATQEGLIKKTPLSQFSDVRSSGILAMKLKVASLPLPLPLPHPPCTPAGLSRPPIDRVRQRACVHEHGCDRAKQFPTVTAWTRA